MILFVVWTNFDSGELAVIWYDRSTCKQREIVIFVNFVMTCCVRNVPGSLAAWEYWDAAEVPQICVVLSWRNQSCW